MHPLHARQSGAGHRHPAGPQPETERLAVRQDPEVGLRQILLLQAVLVVSRGQDLLDISPPSPPTHHSHYDWTLIIITIYGTSVGKN